MARKNTGTVRVYEVLYTVDGPGRYGDGTVIDRFRIKADAEAFARGLRYHGGPAIVSAVDAPRDVARRWGI